MKMLIIIDGGCIQSIHTDRDVEVVVSDHDCKRMGDESISRPPVTVAVPMIVDELIVEQEEFSDGTQRPGSPDGSLATETRKPGSLK